MRRWIAVVVMLLLLAGCAAPPVSESESGLDIGVDPMMLYSESLSAEYEMDRATYFAQERTAADHTQWGYVLIDDDGSMHDCGEGPHLIWFVTSETHYTKTFGVCIHKLPEGEWTAMSDVTQKGVFVHNGQEMWLVTREGTLEKLFDIPDAETMRLSVAEPLYYVSFGQELYRGSLATGDYERIVSLPDADRVIVDIKPITSWEVQVVTAESENPYRNWDFSLKYEYKKEDREHVAFSVRFV